MKKKISFFMYDIGVGGIERMLINTLNAIDYSRYDVTLYLCKTNGLWNNMVNSRVRIRLLENEVRKFGILRKKTVEYYDLGIVYRYDHAYYFSRYLQGNDIAFVHGDLAYQDYYTHYLESTIKGRIKRAIIRKAIKRMRHIYAVSENSRESFEKYWKTKCDMLYNCIDISAIRKLSKEPIDIKGEYYVVVSRFDPNKHILDAVKAFEMTLKEYSDYKLIIIGDGPEKDSVKAYCNKNTTLSDKVVFKNFSENPYNYMAKARSVLFPSTEEAFGLVALEANALGVPLIAYKNRGVQNLCINSAIITEQKPEAMAEAIIKLNNSEILRSTLIGNGLSNAEKYDITAYAESFKELLEENL